MRCSIIETGRTIIHLFVFRLFDVISFTVSSEESKSNEMEHGSGQRKYEFLGCSRNLCKQHNIAVVATGAMRNQRFLDSELIFVRSLWTVVVLLFPSFLPPVQQRLGIPGLWCTSRLFRPGTVYFISRSWPMCICDTFCWRRSWKGLRDSN